MQTLDHARFIEVLNSLKTEGRMLFPVATASMEPLIQARSMVEVVPVDRNIERFDIIVFWNGSVLTCHFVWHINRAIQNNNEPVYITRSMLGHDDLPVSARNVLGLVVSHRIAGLLKLKLNLLGILERLRS